MKLSTKLLPLSLAALCAAGAQAAAPAVSENFYVSGASAARKLTPFIAANVCVTGTVVRYQYSVTNGDYNLTICTLKTNAVDPTVPPELSGDTVAIYGRAASGSLAGLKPTLVPQKIRFLDPASCATADAVDSTVQDCTALLGADYGATGTIPDLGVTDEDPQFLGNIANEEDPSQPDPLTVAERNVLNGVTSNGFTTQTAYQTIWVVQAGLNLPLSNISYEAWRGVMAGNLTSVGDVMRTMGLVPSAAQKAAGLKICLRTNTSGTAAGQLNLALGSNYCGTPGVLPQLNETSDDGVVTGRPANYDVVLNSSSSTLESCLTTAADLDRTIGINSLENAGSNANIKELQIDGIAATEQNAAQGRYKWFHESSINWNTDFLDGAGTIAGRSTAAQRNAYKNLFIVKASEPAQIAASAIKGILATPFNGTPDLVWNPANPVSWASKFVGFGGSNCNEPLVVFPTPEVE